MGWDGDRVTAAAPAVKAGQPDGTVVFIQYLRGIAPVLVVWAHLSGFWLYVHHGTWSVQTDWAYYIAAPLGLYQNAGHLGVVLFFFVSGYIVSMASSQETVRSFAIRRVFRLAPAVWLALLIVALSRYIDHSITHSYPVGTGGGTVTSYVGAGFLADMIGGTTQINTVTWTLVVEMMFYFLIAASIPLSRRRPALSTVAMLLAWVALALALNHFSSTRHLDAFTVYGWLLILGRAFYLTHRQLVSPRVGLALSAGITVVGAAVYQHCLPELLDMAGGPANSYLLGALIFLALMYGAPRRIPWAVRKLSDISYSLYLLHMPVGMLVIDLVIHAGGSFSWAFSLAVIASLLAATLSHRAIEKPAQRLGRQLASRVRGPSAARAALSNTGLPAEPHAIEVLVPTLRDANSD
jgi:peptidoglycan/LPS O-acetylase OafA/YrhL